MSVFMVFPLARSGIGAAKGDNYPRNQCAIQAIRRAWNGKSGLPEGWAGGAQGVARSSGDSATGSIDYTTANLHTLTHFYPFFGATCCPVGYSLSPALQLRRRQDVGNPQQLAQVNIRLFIQKCLRFISPEKTFATIRSRESPYEDQI